MLIDKENQLITEIFSLSSRHGQSNVIKLRVSLYMSIFTSLLVFLAHFMTPLTEKVMISCNELVKLNHNG